MFLNRAQDIFFVDQSDLMQPRGMIHGYIQHVPANASRMAVRGKGGADELGPCLGKGGFTKPFRKAQAFENPVKGRAKIRAGKGLFVRQLGAAPFAKKQAPRSIIHKQSPPGAVVVYWPSLPMASTGHPSMASLHWASSSGVPGCL